jgi:hypothetical protein
MHKTNRIRSFLLVRRRVSVSSWREFTQIQRTSEGQTTHLDDSDDRMTAACRAFNTEVTLTFYLDISIFDDVTTTARLTAVCGSFDDH